MKGARSLGILGWLYPAALIVGLISLLTYSLSASDLMRSDYPGLSAWWEAHQFYFMEGGATVFGLLLGIRVGGLIGADPDHRFRAGMAALLLALVLYAPLIHVFAAVARLGWDGRSAWLASSLISRYGYESGRQVDKVLISGIYFVKTAGFALMAGLALMVIGYVSVVAKESPAAAIPRALPQLQAGAPTSSTTRDS